MGHQTRNLSRAFLEAAFKDHDQALKVILDFHDLNNVYLEHEMTLLHYISESQFTSKGFRLGAGALS